MPEREGMGAVIAYLIEESFKFCFGMRQCAVAIAGMIGHVTRLRKCSLVSSKGAAQD